MSRNRWLSLFAIILLATGISAGAGQTFPQSQDDPVLKKLIELGKNDNQVMNILDTVTNRFGGRYTGTAAYISSGGDPAGPPYDDGTAAHRVFQRYLDTYTWRNPRTNASLRWTVPRDEVRVVPVRAY